MTPTSDRFDVIIIGSGLGGLSAAAFLAASGRSPLVLERSSHPGGVAAAFTRGPYTIDPAIHTLNLGERLLFSRSLNYLGVKDLVEFTPVGTIFEVSFPDARVRVEHGPEGFVESITAGLGSDARDGLAEFAALCKTMHREVHQLPPALSLKELEAAVARFPTLFKYRGATLQEVLDECVGDPRARSVIGACWPWFGLPPESLSFFTAATPYTTYIDNGPFQALGSNQSLVDAIIAAIERRDGEIVCDAEVEKILVEDGKVAGVRLADQSELRSELVISAADARRTVKELAGPEHFPKSYLKRLDRMKTSLSAVVVFAATDLDVSHLPQTCIACEHWTHAEGYQGVLDGRAGGHWLTIPTLHDPSLAPPGEHLLIITCLARFDADRDAVADQVLQLYEERYLPGLREHLKFLEVASPRTIARYQGNDDGPIYGWENSPANAGSRRLHHDTAVEGLYLCGHFTQPGSGAFRAFFSGAEAAMKINGARYADKFMRTLLVD
jgi:prolycopene isomerase